MSLDDPLAQPRLPAEPRIGVDNPRGIGEYVFKARKELLFGILGAAVMFLVQLGMDFDPATITDPQTYVLTAIGGLIRTICLGLATMLGMAAVRFRG